MTETHARLTLPFNAHDAVLLGYTVDWAAGSCIIQLRHHSGCKQLQVQRLRGLTLTRAFPWGESACINELTIESAAVTIELQSGDVIRIEGEYFPPDLP